MLLMNKKFKDYSLKASKYDTRIATKGGFLYLP